jgi:hypothetical protein
MKTITIQTRRSKALSEWMLKEEGSFEDHKKSDKHVYAILSRFGGKIQLTEEEALTVIKSGKYHCTAWFAEEIVGGEKTIRLISKTVQRILNELNK